MSGEKAHSDLGASVAARWLACPGSVRMSRDIPDSGGSSSYAQEGTRAHTLAELCLSKGTDPDAYEGMTIGGGLITDDMSEHVRVYVDHVRSLIRLCWADEWWVERKFSLASLSPPAAMYGTADFVGYERSIRRLHVADLKFGVGVVVEVKGNTQLRYYALGALLSLDVIVMPVDDVEITIAQPRVGHADGVIRSEVISVHELVEFAAELMAAARRTLEPDAPLHAGSHCRFCRASGSCPEQRSRALAIAQSSFDVIDAEFTPPAPAAIPPAEFSDMLGKLHILDDWIKAMRQTAVSRLERGEEVVGFKLVAKRATRKWTNEETAIELLHAASYSADEIYVPRDIKSVAQIEKLVGKKGLVEWGLSDFIAKVSSGWNLAAASDPRPTVSVLTVGEEFALAAGPSDEE